MLRLKLRPWAMKQPQLIIQILQQHWVCRHGRSFACVFWHAAWRVRPASLVRISFLHSEPFDPEEVRRGMLYLSNRMVARWQTRRSWEQKGRVWRFLGGERQIELPVKPLTEIRLWAVWNWTLLWGHTQHVEGKRVWIIFSGWFWQDQRCSKPHQSRALIAQREEQSAQIMSAAYSLPWCSALIWSDSSHTHGHMCDWVWHHYCW